MNKTTKLVLLAVAVGILHIFFLRGCLYKGQEIKEIKTALQIKEVPVNHWIDAAGKDHATQQEAEVSSKAAIVALGMVPGSSFDSVCRLLKIKPKQVMGVNQIDYVDTGSIIANYVETHPGNDNLPIGVPGRSGDTDKKEFQYSDNYLWIDGVIRDDGVHIRYKMDDSLQIVSYWHRKWFLGAKILFFDGSLSNKNAYIRGMSGVRIKDKIPGRIGIGPFIGIAPIVKTTGFGFYPTFGIGVFYSLVRF